VVYLGTKVWNYKFNVVIMRWFIAFCALLLLMFSFQLRGVNLVSVVLPGSSGIELPWMFITNKVIRYLINDVATLALLWSLFKRADFIQFAFWVFFLGLFLLLPAYFVGYFYFAESLGITLRYLHRLVLNPTLMMLLIPLFYFQEKMEKAKTS
jgi:exosortase F-associated protein